MYYNVLRKIKENIDMLLCLKAIEKGAQIFENSTVIGIKNIDSRYLLKLSDGKRII